eukprot:CAMPEP_0206177954 /NCGR_PEP_ID=MMETSP1474-20131121/62788_1 /ASSEMBLY_ACC=CAM_ASM_001110 /TAXON_ID=97495 /ORGANISM="Imantonia sp., Strain RCC918" /LENGTH=86 /DNA_ID=CAMNT_0053590089 /DNA_START=7 /DNA_END=266 /DNA_ORIENTATION=-
MTIINLALHWCGDMREDRLTSLLLACQLLSNGAALLIRYKLAGLFYDVVQERKGAAASRARLPEVIGKAESAAHRVRQGEERRAGD